MSIFDFHSQHSSYYIHTIKSIFFLRFQAWHSNLKSSNCLDLAPVLLANNNNNAVCACCEAVVVVFSLAMASPGPGRRAHASSLDSSSGATNLTFVTLPLTPPAGRFSLTDQGELEASSKPNPNLLPSTSLLAAKAPLAFKDGNASFQYVSEKQQSRILSPSPSLARKPSLLSRGPSFGSRDGGNTPSNPYTRVYSMGSDMSSNEMAGRELINHSKGSSQLARKKSDEMYNSKGTAEGIWRLFSRIMRPGPRPSKKLLVLIVLNIAYSTIEFLIGLFTRRIGVREFACTYNLSVIWHAVF